MKLVGSEHNWFSDYNWFVVQRDVRCLLVTPKGDYLRYPYFKGQKIPVDLFHDFTDSGEIVIKHKNGLLFFPADSLLAQ